MHEKMEWQDVERMIKPLRDRIEALEKQMQERPDARADLIGPGPADVDVTPHAPLTRDEAERIVREVTGDAGADVNAAESAGRWLAWSDWGRAVSHHSEARPTQAEALQAVVDAVRAVTAARVERADEAGGVG